MEAALKKLFAIALLAAFAGTSGTTLAAKKAKQAPLPTYSEPYGAAPAYGPYGPYIEAPVALPYGGGAYPGYGGCSTDEGYGRRGSCDSF
jgi:hypothetical protein